MTRPRAVLALTATLLALASPVGAQQAASVSDVGWWSRRPGAVPEVDGAFEVARGPDNEDLSIAAVRLDVRAASLFRAVLSLAETGGTLQDRAVLNVCGTSTEWASPANPGAIEDAPAPDCDAGSVALRRDATTGRWTGDVQLLLSGKTGEVSVVIVTAPPESPLPVDPGFRVTFADARIFAEGSTATAEPDAQPPAAELPDDPAAAAPLPASEPQPAAPAPAPAPNPPAAAAPVQEPGSFPTQPLGEADPGQPKPWWRLAIFVPVSLAVGVAVARGRAILAGRAA